MNDAPANIFDRIVYFLDHTEVSFVTLLAKVIPLIVPIIPANVGYIHVVNKVTGLGFDPWVGWIYGAVIEGLGYAAIYKAVQFWEHNRKYTEGKSRAPLTMAIAIYAVYLVVTLTVNVVLDYKAGVVLYKVIALGLISLLSVPAGLLMSISAIHTERTQERKRANEQARTERAERKRTEQANEQRTNARFNERTPERTPNENDKQSRLAEHIERLQSQGLPVPGPSELSRQLQMSKSYISERLKQWREDQS